MGERLVYATTAALYVLADGSWNQIHPETCYISVYQPFRLVVMTPDNQCLLNVWLYSTTYISKQTAVFAMFSTHDPNAPGIEPTFHGLCFTRAEDCDTFVNVIEECAERLTNNDTSEFTLEAAPAALARTESDVERPLGRRSTIHIDPNSVQRGPTTQAPSLTPTVSVAFSKHTKTNSLSSPPPQITTIPELPRQMTPPSTLAPSPTANRSIDLKVTGVERRVARRASGLGNLLRAETELQVFTMEIKDGDKTFLLNKTMDELTEFLEKVKLVSPEMGRELETTLANATQYSVHKFFVSVLEKNLQNLSPYKEFLRVDAAAQVGASTIKPSNTGRLQVKIGGNFKEYYCVLMARQLFLYKNEKVANPVKVVVIDGAEISSKGAKPKKKNTDQGLAFYIKTLKTDYKVKAPNKLIADQWVQLLNTSVQECKDISVLGQLKVKLLEGKNLASRDLNGYSDPFAYIIAENQQHKTSTVYKNLNPKWNDQEYTFDITNGAGWIHVLLWDEDRFKASDFMGKVDIPLSAIENGGTVCQWMPLCPRKDKEKITGELCIQLSYSYKELPSANVGYQASSGNTKVFKVPLNELLQREGTTIPKLVTKAIDYIRAKAMNEEGIFRLSGALHTIQDYKAKVDAGVDVDFSSERDPHAVSGLMKLYFRELPEPLLTFNMFDAFLATSKLEGAQAAKALSDLVAKLPPTNYGVLKYLISFLYELKANEATTKMGCPNLAIVFGPQLLRQKVETMETVLLAVDINQVVTNLIQEYPSIFKN